MGGAPGGDEVRLRRQDEAEAARIAAALAAFEALASPLPGIARADARDCLVEQIVESQRRVRYVKQLLVSDLSRERMNSGDHFDPLKASVLHHRAGRTEEAFWLVFLYVHFGRHPRAGWRYVRDVYGALGATPVWTWERVSSGVAAFREWLDRNYDALTAAPRPRGFGNHRKYESLSGSSSTGTGAVVESYVQWVGEAGSHAARFEAARRTAEGNPNNAFDSLYRSLSTVDRFGRTARFDYLTMAGRLDLAEIRPGRAYLVGSTGPLKGARLLFRSSAGEQLSAAGLDKRVIELDAQVQVGFDVLEDALCNWQKSPTNFKPFRG